MSEPVRSRGIVWWFAAILSPIGVAGGPIAIAQLLAGIVEWHGLIGYLVTLWSENIRPPFQTLGTWITDQFELPAPPALILDYIIIGLLVSTSYMRARFLIPKHSGVYILGQSAAYLFAWPISIVLLLVSAFREGVRSWPAFLLTLAPFALFFMLWAVNALLGIA